MSGVALTIPETLPQPVGRRFPYLAWLCALSPFILLLVFITLGLHIRLGLGHWPRPVLEDHNTPAFNLHERFLELCMLFAVFAAGPLWLLCLLLRPLRPAWPGSTLAQLGLFALSWLLIFLVLSFDPTSFSAWWLD